MVVVMLLGCSTWGGYVIGGVVMVVVMLFGV